MRLVKQLSLLVPLVATSALALSQEADGHLDPGENEVAELARSAQNPLADMISVPFQNNTNFNVGPEDKTQNVLNIQPVYPVNLSNDWNMITRTIIPVISQPPMLSGQSRKNGIGDIQFTAFFAPVQPTSSGWMWGAGAIAQLDTATDDRLGQGKWGLGPSLLALRSDGAFIYGALINNVFEIAGDDNGNDLNQMLVQPFVNYNFPNIPGRYLTFAPIITANWEASSGNKWTVPLGGGIGQIIKLGELPLNLQASAYYNVETPQYGADWQMRLQAQVLLPK